MLRSFRVAKFQNSITVADVIPHGTGELVLTLFGDGTTSYRFSISKIQSSILTRSRLSLITGT